MEIYGLLLPGIIISLIVLNLVVSLLMLFFPNVLMKINSTMSKWYSTDKFEEAMNKPRNIDHSIMGLNKFFGIISLLLAVFLIYYYTKI